MARDLDLLLIGATGFTGRLAAAYLRAHAPPGLRWGVAGRDPARLEAVAQGAPAVRLDLRDAAQVDGAVASARVVASTAGPFALIGDAVVDACVARGAHYVDITGETAWARRLIDRHHLRARAGGTRIVPFCGFDSVPADLAVLRLARAAAGGLADVTTVYRLRGGLNGGTLASALNLAESEERRALADPFLLAPDAQVDADERRRQWDPRRPLHMPSTGRWVAPFFMGPINRRVVMRSHALAALHPPPGPDGTPLPLDSYGAGFRYREYQAAGRGGRLGASATTLALGLLEAALARSAGRALLRRLGPKPGEGPSERARTQGRTRATTTARTEDGRALRLDLDAAGDPGNTVTVRILCEAALALCDPPAALGLGAPDTGGVLTPALALGEHLLARLERTGAYELSGAPE